VQHAVTQRRRRYKSTVWNWTRLSTRLCPTQGGRVVRRVRERLDDETGGGSRLFIGLLHRGLCPTWICMPLAFSPNLAPTPLLQLLAPSAERLLISAVTLYLPARPRRTQPRAVVSSPLRAAFVPPGPAFWGPHSRRRPRFDDVFLPLGLGLHLSSSLTPLAEPGSDVMRSNEAPLTLASFTTDKIWVA
jgi:hypothetical protein